VLLFGSAMLGIPAEGKTRKRPKKRPKTTQRIDIDMRMFTLTFSDKGKVIKTMPISGGGEYPFHWKD
jgi:hypothetical protein